MTLKDVIERLQSCPPEAIPVVNLGRNELASGGEVTDVTVMRAHKILDQWYEWEPGMEGEPVLVVNINA